MASITSLFASDVLVKILTVFLLNPEKQYYQAEIYRQIGGTLRNVQKMLLKLEETGLIHHFKQGNMTYYQANQAHAAFGDLKHLFLKTTAIGDLLRAALNNVHGDIQLAFIYGSFARGEETAESDVDIFILGKLPLKDAAAITGPITEQTGREINPVIYSQETFLEMQRNHNRFAQELLSCPKIWLIGSDNELNKLVS